MNKNSSGFALVSIIIILGIVAGVYLVLNPSLLPSLLQNTPADIPDTTTSPSPNTTLDWKTFRDSRFPFEFKYPSSWSYIVPPADSSYGPIEIKNEKNELVISIGSFDPSIVGISYCEATPQDEKCETLVTESGIWVTIDWDLDGKAYAIFDGTSIALEKVTRNTKQIFRQILSTFKFIDDNNETTQPITGEGCVIGGCSSEICAEEEMFSTCVLKPETVCYQSANCERQSDGSCGWTQTEELTACLAEYQ